MHYLLKPKPNGTLLTHSLLVCSLLLFQMHYLLKPKPNGTLLARSLLICSLTHSLTHSITDVLCAQRYAAYTEAVKEILLFQWRLSDGLSSKESDIIAKQQSIEQWEKPQGITGFFRGFKSKESQIKSAVQEKEELTQLRVSVCLCMHDAHTHLSRRTHSTTVTCPLCASSGAHSVAADTMRFPELHAFLRLCIVSLRCWHSLVGAVTA
jgi:hypothetical protein